MYENYFEGMNRARRAYTGVFEDMCRKWELTQNEIDVLLFLWNNPGHNRPADIVHFRGIIKSHVSLSVGHLAQLGLLRREIDPVDRRTVHLFLTEAAHPAVIEAKKIQDGFFERLLNGISEEEVALYQRIDAKIHKNVATMAHNIKRLEE